MMGTGAGVQIRVRDRLAGNLMGARCKGGSFKHKETGGRRMHETRRRVGDDPSPGLQAKRERRAHSGVGEIGREGRSAWRQKSQKGQQGCNGRMDREGRHLSCEWSGGEKNLPMNKQKCLRS